MSNEKVVRIAKQFVLGKLEGQKQLLKKHGLRNHDYSVVEKMKNLEAEDAAKLRTRALKEIVQLKNEMLFTFTDLSL